MTQRLQVFMQNQIFLPIINNKSQLTPPWALRLLARFAMLRRIPGRLVGLGFRPEYIHTPDIYA